MFLGVGLVQGYPEGENMGKFSRTQIARITASCRAIVFKRTLKKIGKTPHKVQRYPHKR
jgi:hypothetical protein